MKIRKETFSVYVTEDGKRFENEDDANLYVEKIKDVKAFKISYDFDFTEGSGYKKYGYALVRTTNNHSEFLEYELYKILGNRIGFVQGVHSSNAISKSWKFDQVNFNDVDKNNIIVKVEDSMYDDSLFDDIDKRYWFSCGA